MLKETDEKEKIKERIVVFLVCLILIIVGLIMLKEEDSPIKFEDNSNEPVVINQTNNIDTVTKTNTQIININKASIEELDSLPGIGSIIAGRIIDYREENGSFKNIEEIMEVSGIGEVKFEKIRNLITI